ncbi:hypothetical protein [Psychroflexus sp. MES1-P1E]|uniref:hypothetical protein n=1 Tax=Psychroflexus sp. MES1-P1E TaxID=2058320 RepID=UPI000C7E6C5B|nr:hypothetical protein [Psychroflexus sp. MES1-P1E]PKG43741.1 hypothetical protein CXF67_03370 [Psychroflexus sp. MES1-P1E]
MKFLNSIKEYILLIILIFIISSCNKNNDDNIIVDYGGAAQYFINNQTAKNIIIIFQKSEELGLEIDTTNVIEKNTSSKILEDAIIGANPVPKNSFREIKIYESTDLNNPFIILSPVENEDWTIISQDLGSSAYGLTTYEIKLTD